MTHHAEFPAQQPFKVRARDSEIPPTTLRGAIIMSLTVYRALFIKFEPCVRILSKTSSRRSFIYLGTKPDIVGDLDSGKNRTNLPITRVEL